MGICPYPPGLVGCANIQDDPYRQAGKYRQGIMRAISGGGRLPMLGSPERCGG